MFLPASQEFSLGDFHLSYYMTKNDIGIEPFFIYHNHLTYCGRLIFDNSIMDREISIDVFDYLVKVIRKVEKMPFEELPLHVNGDWGLREAAVNKLRGRN